MEYICTNCGFQGRPTKIGRIKMIKELLIWLLFRANKIFYFLWKTHPRYTACPKCKKSSMSFILNIYFPEYYSLYARIYTLSYLLLQQTDLKDFESQKLILKQIDNFLKFVGNPIRLLLHEIDSFEQLINELIVLIKNNNSEIAILSIRILYRINIDKSNAKIITSIGEFITIESQKNILEALGVKDIINLCDNHIIKQSLLKRTQKNPDLYLFINKNIFDEHELRLVFQSLLLEDKNLFLKIVKYYNYNPPFKLKKYVSSLIIYSLHYEKLDYKTTKKILYTIERLGINKTDTRDLKKSLKIIYYKGGSMCKKLIKQFALRNKICL
ncbi:hypothetical protein M0R01_01725 [bacterium]|nr:hypothetical protein [bacterium]